MTKVTKGAIDYEEFRVLVFQKRILDETAEAYFHTVKDLIRRVEQWKLEVDKAEDTTRDDWANADESEPQQNEGRNFPPNSEINTEGYGEFLEPYSEKVKLKYDSSNFTG